MGRSPVRTTKTPCSRDLPFDLSILSVSFSNDLAMQTFMLSLLFWAMIGCSSKLRSAQCDGCVSLTFMSPHQPRQPPMNLLWCDPCEKTFHEDLSSNVLFSANIIPVSPSNTKAFGFPVSFAWKGLCVTAQYKGLIACFSAVVHLLCSLEYRLIKGL